MLLHLGEKVSCIFSDNRENKRTTIMNLKNIEARVRVFAKAYGWLIVDFANGAGAAAVRVVFFATIFILFRIFGFSAVLKLVGSMDYAFLAAESELEFYFGYSLGLVEATGLAWLLVMLTSTAGYIFYRSVFESTHQHMLGLFGRALCALNNWPTIGAPFPILANSTAKVITQVIINVRSVNVLSRIIFFSIFETISFLVCFVLLLWMHTLTTLVLLGAGLIFIPAYYFLGLEGIRSRRGLKIANRDLAKNLHYFEKNLSYPQKNVSDEVREFIQSPRVSNAFDLFKVQRMVIFKSEYLGWFLIASIAVICVFWMSYLLSQEVRISGWYFGIFLVMMYSLIRSLRSIISSSRFLDSATFCAEILTPLKSAEPAGTVKDGVKLTFKSATGDAEDICAGDYVLIESIQPRNIFALSVCAAHLHVAGQAKVQMQLLSFEAEDSDIQRALDADRVPVFVTQAPPNLCNLPAPLADLKNSLPVFILVRGRLVSGFEGAEPKLVMTIAGTKLVRHWISASERPFEPYARDNQYDSSGEKFLESDLDADEFM